MLDTNTQAAKNFYKAVLKFSETAKDWQGVVLYDTTPDERWDVTLVSRRVYGNRHEVIAVLAAAKMDSVEQELKQQRLRLPSPAMLYQLKQQTGFESNPDYRENGQPTWL